MADVKIMGKRGSKAKLAISQNAGIPLYRGGKCDCIINYGLSGANLEAIFRKFPASKPIPIINRSVGHSKYSSVKSAEKHGISVPETKLSLGLTDKLSDWIEKRVNSSKGFGIRQARGRAAIAGKYFQKMVKNRRFELRVHAFAWIPQNEWVLNKRLGPANQIAWNFHQGGHFSRVIYPNKYNVFAEAKEISASVLKMHNMAFGAVDLIVDTNMKIYYIEVNSSPGFEELNRQVYAQAFGALKQLPAKAVRKFAW